MLPETTKNPVVENSTNNKNNVQSVSRSHPSPFTAASRSAESPACSIPEVVVPGKSDLLLSPLSNVFSSPKIQATNHFANVPGAVKNGSSLTSDDISFTTSEEKVLNWDNTEVSTFGSKTASDPDTPSSTPPDDSHSTEFSTTTTLTSCNGQLGAQPRVEDGFVRARKHHPNNSGARVGDGIPIATNRRQENCEDSVFTGDSATLASYGPNQLESLLREVHSIPNVGGDNQPRGISLIGIVTSTNTSELFANAYRPRLNKVKRSGNGIDTSLSRNRRAIGAQMQRQGNTDAQNDKGNDDVEDPSLRDEVVTAYDLAASGNITSPIALLSPSPTRRIQTVKIAPREVAKKYAPTAPAASLNLNAGPKTAGENENGGVASEKASDGRAPPDILAMFNKLSSETKENRKKNNDPNDYPYRNTK